MTCKELGSFPNSRVATRKPTQNEFTYSVDIPTSSTVGTYDPAVDGISESDIGRITTKGNVLVAIKNPERTLLTLRHFSDAPNSTIIRYGFEDRADLLTNAMPLGMRDSVDTDGPQAVFVRNTDNTNTTQVHIHYGIG